jgi:hypothetical protein
LRGIGHRQDACAPCLFRRSCSLAKLKSFQCLLVLGLGAVVTIVGFYQINIGALQERSYTLTGDELKVTISLEGQAGGIV